MNPDAPRMTPDDLYDRMERGDDIIAVDVRRGSYNRSDVKAKDAVRIDPNTLVDDFEQIPAGSEVVTYCTCPSENTSAGAAAFLREKGYTAAALAGGFEAWEEAGYPTEPK